MSIGTKVHLWLLGTALAAAAPLAGAQDEWADATRRVMAYLAGGNPRGSRGVLAVLDKQWEKSAEFLGRMRARVAALAPRPAAGDAKPDREAVAAASAALVKILAGGGKGDFAARGAAAGVAARSFLQRLDGLRVTLMLRRVQAGMTSGARFAGQYEVLAKLGPDARELILGVVENPPQSIPDDFVDPLRVTLLSALRDVTEKVGPKDVERIRAFTEDEFEDEDLKDMAVYVLYRYGHKDLLAKKVAALEEATGAEGQELASWRKLADLYWQVRDYPKAVAAYEHCLRYAGDMPAQDLAILYYNMACSQSLAQRVDDAFKSLDAALTKGAAGISDDLLRVDHDIDALRKDPRFPELMKKHGREAVLETKKAAGKAAGDGGK